MSMAIFHCYVSSPEGINMVYFLWLYSTIFHCHRWQNSLTTIFPSTKCYSKIFSSLITHFVVYLLINHLPSTHQTWRAWKSSLRAGLSQRRATFDSQKNIPITFRIISQLWLIFYRSQVSHDWRAYIYIYTYIYYMYKLVSN